MARRILEALNGRPVGCVFDEPDAKHSARSNVDTVTRVVSRTYHIDSDGPETDYYQVTYRAEEREPSASRNPFRKLISGGCGGRQFIDPDIKGGVETPNGCLACRADLSYLRGEPIRTVKGKYPEIID